MNNFFSVSGSQKSWHWFECVCLISFNTNQNLFNGGKAVKFSSDQNDTSRSKQIIILNWMTNCMVIIEKLQALAMKEKVAFEKQPLESSHWALIMPISQNTLLKSLAQIEKFLIVKPAPTIQWDRIRNYFVLKDESKIIVKAFICFPSVIVALVSYGDWHCLKPP